MVVIIAQGSVIRNGGAWMLDSATIVVGTEVTLTFQKSIAVVVTAVLLETFLFENVIILTWWNTDDCCK